MPTYEYRCGGCQNEFEKVQKMSEEPRAQCPVCGAEATRRLSGGAGLLFKGSGFYITDYRSESYKKAAGADRGPDKPAGDGGSGAKGESGSGGEKSASSSPAESKASGSKDS